MIPFDEMILPKEMQMLKAFLPFLPPQLQKMLAIYIKWSELTLTIQYFQQYPPRQTSMEPVTVLNCIKELLPPEEQSQLEQFSDIFENMDMYRDMFEGFSSAFAPDQKED